MINRISTVTIFVKDQDRAKAFYTEKLGFELKNDTPLYPGAAVRWLAVAPAGSDTELILYLADENWAHYEQTIGKPQNFTMAVTNLAELHTDLKAKGVNFTTEPTKEFWGSFAFVEDSEGNQLLLVEN